MLSPGILHHPLSNCVCFHASQNKFDPLHLKKWERVGLLMKNNVNVTLQYSSLVSVFAAAGQFVKFRVSVLEMFWHRYQFQW